MWNHLYFLLTHLFFLQILRVKLQVVELNGEAARVPDNYFLLISDTVWEDWSKLKHVLVKVQPWLGSLTTAQQQNSLTALCNSDWNSLLIEFLKWTKNCSVWHRSYKSLIKCILLGTKIQQAKQFKKNVSWLYNVLFSHVNFIYKGNCAFILMLPTGN